MLMVLQKDLHMGPERRSREWFWVFDLSTP